MPQDSFFFLKEFRSPKVFPPFILSSVIDDLRSVVIQNTYYHKNTLFFSPLAIAPLLCFSFDPRRVCGIRTFRSSDPLPIFPLFFLSPPLFFLSPLHRLLLLFYPLPTSQPSSTSPMTTLLWRTLSSSFVLRSLIIPQRNLPPLPSPCPWTTTSAPCIATETSITTRKMFAGTFPQYCFSFSWLFLTAQ